MYTSKSEKSMIILMPEDNPGDVDLARDVLENIEMPVTLHVVGDGEAAMDFLRRTGKYKDAPRPDIILLDLNIPKKDGREFLAEIQADEDLKQIPVVIMTTSKSEEDILKTYNLHAKCYITKPVSATQFLDVVRAINGKEFFKNVALFSNERLITSNHIILGKINDIDHKTGRIFYTISSQSAFRTSEYGHKGKILFDTAGQSCFVCGKIFFRPPDTIILTPEGEIEINKRTETRVETPVLPARISYKRGLLHREIKGSVINISSCGASISTHEQLMDNISYQLETAVPVHHVSLKLSFHFSIKFCTKSHGAFVYGVLFTDIDSESKKNLGKYISKVTS